MVCCLRIWRAQEGSPTRGCPRWARQSNLQLERRGSTSEADEDRTLGRLRTSMLLAGDYRDIRRFLYELETSPEFIVIEEVGLESGK